MTRAETQQILRKLGGPAKVARLLGISRQAISQWDKIPIERAFQIHQLTQGEFPVQKLRPDLFKDFELTRVS